MFRIQKHHKISVDYTICLDIGELVMSVVVLPDLLSVNSCSIDKKSEIGNNHKIAVGVISEQYPICRSIYHRATEDFYVTAFLRSGYEGYREKNRHSTLYYRYYQCDI